MLAALCIWRFQLTLDLTLADGFVSRFLEKLNGVKRIFKYLAATTDKGIIYNSDRNLTCLVTVMLTRVAIRQQEDRQVSWFSCLVTLWSLGARKDR